LQNVALNGSAILTKRGQSNDQVIPVAALTSGNIPYAPITNEAQQVINALTE
jgi:hypothetical protein